MFGEAVRLAESSSDLVSSLGSLLAKEHTFVKWVSLRGGLAFISIALEDPKLSLDNLTAFAKGPPPDGTEGLIRGYSSLESASFSDVLGDPNLVRDPSWHIELIAWCASAFAGGNLHRTVLQADIPAAQRLSDPGWYAEPVFSKCERYWDGADWTARCRALEGRRWESIVSPF